MATENIMGKKSRTKGANGEREFIRTVDILTDGKVRLRRNLEQARNGGDDCLGHDVFSIEIKRHKSAREGDIGRWWKQTVNNSGDKHPALAYRLDFQRWKVMVHPPYDFFPLNDSRGCITMDIDMFCQILLHHDVLNSVYYATGQQAS